MKSVRDSLQSVDSKAPWAMLALLLSYTALAWLGLQWAVIRGAGSPVWPASGLALAALMMGGIRLWPAILLGRLLAGWLSGSQQPFWAELLLAIANTLAAVLPLMLTRKRGLLKPGLHDLTALLNYLVWGCLAGALIAAPLGTAALVLSSELSVPAMIATLSNWIIAYFVGAILVGPLLLS